MLKRFGLLLALVLTVSLSVGCAKNVTPEPAQPQVDAAAEAAAAAERAVKVVADGVVYFDFDKYDIKEEFRAILNEKAEILKAYPQGEERKAINAVFDEIVADLKREQILTHCEQPEPLPQRTRPVMPEIPEFTGSGEQFTLLVWRSLPCWGSLREQKHSRNPRLQRRQK